MRKDDGCLHFFVNSTDLGIAAQSVPDNVYGVVDLFGQCAQVTLENTLNGKMNLIKVKPLFSDQLLSCNC